MSTTVAAVVVLIAAPPIAGQTPTAPIKLAVEVTGEFRADGTCRVFADGVPVFRAVDSAQTTYTRAAVLNVAPPGFDTHEVWCAPRSTEEHMPPLDQTERMFVIMLYAPTGQLAQPRKYEVRAGLPSPEAAPYRAGAALFGVSPQMLNDTMPLRMGLLYLAGSRGSVEITRVGEKHVVATFSIHTQRALTM